MPCFWCDAESERLTKDHVVPGSLGGTREYCVWACNKCQIILSKAEHEVARKSFMAIAALASGVRPRHPERAISGRLRPTYLLVKHPLGGYGETLLSAGNQLAALPHIEIKVVPGEPIDGRLRGPSAEGVQCLLDTFRRLLRNPRGPRDLIYELTGSIELDPKIRDDPDFWPRIVLLPGDRLMVRGRDGDEITRFMRAFAAWVASGYNASPASWQQGQNIEGGMIHQIAFNFDPQCVRRIAAKIGYAMFRQCTGRTLEVGIDKHLRAYVLGLTKGPNEPVWIEPHPATMVTSKSPHVVLLSPPADPTAALISLYGYRFRVELGDEASLAESVVVLCNVDGSGMRKLGPDEIEAAIVQFQGTNFGQPWCQLE